jgi:hypothetical protein
LKAAYRGGYRACQNLPKGAIRHAERAQVSARHIRESCPSLWNSWLVQVSALIGVGLLGVVLAVVYKRTGIKPAPT